MTQDELNYLEKLYHDLTASRMQLAKAEAVIVSLKTENGHLRASNSPTGDRSFREDVEWFMKRVYDSGPRMFIDGLCKEVKKVLDEYEKQQRKFANPL